MLTRDALQNDGYTSEAAAVESVRTKRNWFRYATQFINNVQQSMRRLYDISFLRLPLYPSRLLAEDVVKIKQDDADVVWL